MRLPRMTTRRWMVAVVVVGGALGMFERHERFRWIAVRHRAEVPKHLPRIKPVGMEDKVWRLLEWTNRWLAGTSGRPATPGSPSSPIRLIRDEFLRAQAVNNS